jgi:hypothetical protein
MSSFLLFEDLFLSWSLEGQYCMLLGFLFKWHGIDGMLTISRTTILTCRSFASALRHVIAFMHFLLPVKLVQCPQKVVALSLHIAPTITPKYQPPEIPPWRFVRTF